MLQKIVYHLRIWMLTGKMPNIVYHESRRRYARGADQCDIFASLAEILLYQPISAMLMAEYQRAENAVRSSADRLKFFGLDM